MDDSEDSKSKIIKSTNFVLRASQIASSNKSDGLIAKKAEAIRCLQLASLFYNAVSEKHSRESAAAAVKPELDKYRKLADDHSKTGINNYVQSVPRVQIDFDLSKTKTGLLDAKDFLKNFQKQKCQGSFEHCKHLEPTVEDLSKLHKTYQKNIAEENEEDVEMIEEPVKNPELEVSNSSILTEKELKELDEVFDKYKDVHPVFIKSQSKSFEAEILPAHKNESEKKKEIAKSSQINTFPIFQKATKSSTSDLFGTQKEVPTNFSQNIFSDEMQKKQAQDEKEYMRLFYQQPKKSPPKVDNHVFSAPKVPKLSENHKTPSASATMSDLNDLIFGKRETPQPTDTEKEYSRKKRQNQENNEVPAEEPKKCDFKTAYSELRIQNQKKYGNPDHIRPSDLTKGTTRPLGLNRNVGSLSNKFVLPLKNGEESSNLDPEMLADDRLKNIDPKMVETIMNEIMDSGSSVHWNDIAGLDYAKGVIKEAIILPILRPDIFKGLRRPAKGLLLFGPPGTGKTMIGKCIASQSKSTFFNISASAMTSKWIGEGEKMVRALFAVAAVHQPSVIFIDEIDSLLCQRSETEHESSRRLKTEFLVHLDGAGTSEEDKILIVGATNRPQELDEAARRRLEKRLYIPLPEFEARFQIMRNLLQKEKNNLNEQEIGEIAKLADGFSGADMKGLCKEAAMYPIRDLSMNEISEIDATEVRPIFFDDFKSALKSCRASVSQDDLGQYVKWDQTFGSSIKS